MVKVPPITKRKSPRTAAALALVLGIAGPMGVGHIYIGKRGRGLLLLILGVILAVLTWGRLFIGFIKLSLGYYGAVVVDIVFFVLWLLQAYDAYRLAKKSNAGA